MLFSSVTLALLSPVVGNQSPRDDSYSMIDIELTAVARDLGDQLSLLRSLSEVVYHNRFDSYWRYIVVFVYYRFVLSPFYM